MAEDIFSFFGNKGFFICIYLVSVMDVEDILLRAIGVAIA